MSSVFKKLPALRAPRHRKDDAPEESPEAVVTNLADVVEEPIAWLWPGRLAFGKFNLLDGDPGDGKSLFTVDLAARVTTGRPLPGFYSGPEAASVVILAAEDGVADTIKPRFTAAGGDPARVHVMTGTRRGKKDGFPSLTRDVEALGALVRGVGARVVIVDPLTSYLSGVDTHKDAEVRQALSPLVAMAGETGACVLAVRHLSKAEARAALYRGGGSIAFIGVARGALLLARHPDDRARRVVAVSKSNLAAEAASWVFSVTTDEKGRPFISWESRASELTAEDLVKAMDERGKASGSDTAAGAAETFLRAALAHGPRPSKDIEEEAREAHGISERTLNRARQALKVTAAVTTIAPDGAKGKPRRVWKLSLPSGEECQGCQECQGNRPRELGTLQPGGLSESKGAKNPGTEIPAPLAPLAPFGDAETSLPVELPPLPRRRRRPERARAESAVVGIETAVEALEEIRPATLGEKLSGVTARLDSAATAIQREADRFAVPVAFTFDADGLPRAPWQSGTCAVLEDEEAPEPGAVVRCGRPLQPGAETCREHAGSFARGAA